GTPESRFFPLVVAFFPVSAALALASLRRPVVAPAALAACGLGAAALGIRARRPRSDVEALTVAAPLYALGHGLGMWRGLVEVVRSYAHGRRRLRAAVRGAPNGRLVLVHGDTMTTVLGALIGRSLRVPVAHIESGLRSYDVRNPFPEELNRRAASALAGIHYA